MGLTTKQKGKPVAGPDRRSLVAKAQDGCQPKPQPRTAAHSFRPITRAPGIESMRSYLDTVGLYFVVLPDTQAAIRKSMGIGGKSKRLRFDKVISPNGDHGWLIHLHQPTIHELKKFDRLQRKGRGKLFRFDVAYDAVPGIGTSQEELRAWFEASTILVNRRRGWMFDWEDTAYWIFQAKRIKRSEIDVVLYSDLYGKLGGKPVHLEIRVQNTRACRRAGYEYAADLISLDPYRHASKYIRLVKYDPARLAAKFTKRDMRRYWDKARKLHQSRQRENIRSERFRLALPRRIQGWMKRLDLHRAQMVKDYYPAYFRMLERTPLNVLSIPRVLEWGALKHKGNYQKTVWDVDWSWDEAQ